MTDASVPMFKRRTRWLHPVWAYRRVCLKFGLWLNKRADRLIWKGMR